MWTFKRRRTDDGDDSQSDCDAVSRRHVRMVLVAALPLLAVVALPPPLRLEESQLDAGWAYALNVAAAEGLCFGRDIAFTYGPLGFICYPGDYGSNLAIAAVIRLVIHLIWCGSLGFLASAVRPGRYAWLRALVVVLLGSLAALPISIFATNLDRTGQLLAASINLLVYAAVASSSLAALVAAAIAAIGMLVKFNIGVAAFAGLFGYVATRGGFQAVARSGLSCAAAALLVLCGGFVWSGSDLSAFPDYLKVSQLIAADYSSHMGYNESLMNVATFRDRWTIASLIFFAAVLTACVGRDRKGVAVACIVAFPSFMLYKAGVVRCDAPHWQAAAAHGLALAALPAVFVSGRRARIYGATLIGLIVVFAQHVDFRDASSRLGWGPQALRHYVDWSESTERLRRAQATHLADLTREFQFDLRAHPGRPDHGLAEVVLPPDATFDVYPFQLTVVRDERLKLRPRFIPQSYQAYHPELDRRSAESYRSTSGPSHVFYRFEAVDGYHPHFADPLTIAELLRRFRPLETSGRYAVLVRHDRPSFDDEKPVRRGNAKCGEILEAPQTMNNTRLFLKLRISQPIGGKLESFFRSAGPALLRLDFSDGRTRTYEFAWRNAASGLLVDPLPTNHEEALLMFDGKPLPRITAAVVVPQDGFAEEFEYEWTSAAVSSDPAEP